MLIARSPFGNSIYSKTDFDSFIANHQSAEAVAVIMVVLAIAVMRMTMFEQMAGNRIVDLINIAG